MKTFEDLDYCDVNQKRDKLVSNFEGSTENDKKTSYLLAY